MRADGRALLRALAAAALLIAVEGGLLFFGAQELFLTQSERWRAALLDAGAIGTACLLLWALGSAAVRLAGAAGAAPDAAQARRGRWPLAAAAAALTGGASAWILVSLTSGRRLRELPLRPVLVAGLALLAALVVGLLVAWLVRRLRDPERTVGWRPSLVFGLVAAGCVVADAFVLRRLYPALHWALTLGALSAACLAAVAAPARGPTRAWHVLGIPVALVVMAALPGALSLLPSNGLFVVQSRAPVGGKLVRALRRARPAQPAAAGATGGAQGDAPAGGAVQVEGIDLTDRDVLLVTVDALRADMVGAYGSDEDLTPNIDRLASEGVVFRRAYTPTPHTSYALASMLTGKFLRAVLQLPEAPQDHTALPDLLRRYGYRTAAFYPPAIFFVDTHRFRALHERGFGFEYRKEMYAEAPERVHQLSRYLDEAPKDRPLFVWVHLFEPHEPYDPPEGYADGSSDRARYEGEIAVVDEAVGGLVQTFRARRPGATVILSSDHGEEFGDHGGYYHGTTLYDEQIRVPLIWSSPEAAEPGAVDTPVEIVDIATTLLAAAGIPRDARMRGDDLGPVLAGYPEHGPEHAFAGIREARMVTDGRYKAICEEGEPTCRLYDLVEDPHERTNLASRKPEVVGRLREALGRFVGSIPRIEAMAMAQGVGWPEPLARAELGDPTAAPAVVPLLGDARADVREAAARALADLGHKPALPTLARLAEHDADRGVRAEAAIASLRLGDESAVPAVREALAASEGARARRAALALAQVGDASGTEQLIALAADEEASEERRRRAIQALGAIEASGAVEVLSQLLQDVRLRVDAAEALGAIGDRRAGRALAAALEQERYLPARRAEARALAELGHPRAAALVRRFLGTETPLPGGVGILLELEALERPSGAGADLRAAESVRQGQWQCDDVGCAPGADATIVLPAPGGPTGPARAVLRVVAAEDGATLRLDGAPERLRKGAQEVSFPLSAARGERELAVSVDGDVRVVAIAVVAQTAEIPPPEPEPWDAGTPEH